MNRVFLWALALGFLIQAGYAPTSLNSTTTTYMELMGDPQVSEIDLDGNGTAEAFVIDQDVWVKTGPVLVESEFMFEVDTPWRAFLPLDGAACLGSEVFTPLNGTFSVWLSKDLFLPLMVEASLTNATVQVGVNLAWYVRTEANYRTDTQLLSASTTFVLNSTTFTCDPTNFNVKFPSPYDNRLATSLHNRSVGEILTYEYTYLSPVVEDGAGDPFGFGWWNIGANTSFQVRVTSSTTPENLWLEVSPSEAGVEGLSTTVSWRYDPRVGSSFIYLPPLLVPSLIRQGIYA